MFASGQFAKTNVRKTGWFGGREPVKLERSARRVLIRHEAVKFWLEKATLSPFLA